MQVERSAPADGGVQGLWAIRDEERSNGQSGQAKFVESLQQRVESCLIFMMHLLLLWLLGISVP